MHKFCEGESVRITHWDMPERLNGVTSNMNRYAGCDGIILERLGSKSRYRYADEFPPYSVELAVDSDKVRSVYTIREQFLEPVITEIDVDEEAFGYET